MRYLIERAVSCADPNDFDWQIIFETDDDIIAVSDYIVAVKTHEGQAIRIFDTKEKAVIRQNYKQIEFWASVTGTKGMPTSDNFRAIYQLQALDYGRGLKRKERYVRKKHEK